jgi:hypothetical protein
MGWSLSPYTFQKLMEVFTNYLRDPERSTNSSEGILSPPTKAKRKKKEIPYKRAREGHRVRNGYTIL